MGGGGGEPGNDFSAHHTANVVALTFAPSGRSRPSKQAGSPERTAKDPRNKCRVGRMDGRLGGEVTNEWRDRSGLRGRGCRFRRDLNGTWLWRTEGNSREEKREIRVHPRSREGESLATILALTRSQM